MGQPVVELARQGPTEASRPIKGVAPLTMQLISQRTLVARDLPWPPCSTREALEAVAAILSLADGLARPIGSE